MVSKNDEDEVLVDGEHHMRRQKREHRVSSSFSRRRIFRPPALSSLSSPSTTVVLLCLTPPFSLYSLSSLSLLSFTPPPPQTSKKTLIFQLSLSATLSLSTPPSIQIPLFLLCVFPFFTSDKCLVLFQKTQKIKISYVWSNTHIFQDLSSIVNLLIAPCS
ncbi:hypothetical protein L2E82_19927 [Cichorium intybus]|uniref:Uncharacterized protein n=1 Tax=Cichorium intybus TaxID=13427 RepID=A0ACB9DSB8_CICIN|nr:hypothetical protein L2E82_19927 [Cichorium intybus]